MTLEIKAESELSVLFTHAHAFKIAAPGRSENTLGAKRER